VALMATLNLNQVDSFTYSGGIQLATLLSAVILLVVSHPAVGGARVLATPVMQWIGKRSYAIYLWHWPIFELTRPDIDVSLSGWPLTLVRLALVAVAGDLSYRLVEQPFRTGVAQSAFRRLWARRRPISLAGATALAGVLTLLTVELTMAPAVIPSPALAAGSTPAARTPIVPIKHGLAPGTGPASLPAKPAEATIPATTRPAGDVLAIGDSVMLDAADDLKQDLGPATRSGDERPHECVGVPTDHRPDVGHPPGRLRERPHATTMGVDHQQFAGHLYGTPIGGDPGQLV
jgi:hypothetical protein